MISWFKKFRKSIFAKIIVPVLTLTIIQSIVVITVLYFTVIKNTINDSLVKTFESNVNVRKNYIEDLVSNSWGDIDIVYDNFVSKTEKYLVDNSTDVSTILSSKTDSDNYLLKVSHLLTDLIDDNKVNDAYLILNNNFENKDMTYLRTKNPNHTNNAEVEVLYAPTKVWNKFYNAGYALDVNIENNVYSEIANTEFYTSPLDYYNTNKEVVGFWSCLGNIKSTNILSYSKPLVVNDQVVGVIGIGLTESYLKTSLATLNKGEEINIALIRKTNDKIDSSFTSYIDYSIPNLSTINLETTNYDYVYQFDKDGVTEYYYEIQLNVYDDSNPYSQKWYVSGILPKETIFKVSNTTIFNLICVYFFGFIVALFFYLFMAYLITKPIINSSNELQKENVTNITKTNITEVDNLIDQINNYSLKNASLSNKLERLLEASNIEISFFEYSRSEHTISTSNNFFEMLSIQYKSENIDPHEFILKLKGLEKNIIKSTYKKLDDNILEDDGEIIFLISDKYMKMQISYQSEGTFATLIDLTKEYQENKRIRHERDYDVLTGLLNRRGFTRKVSHLFEKEHIGSLFMIDIDNLKFINDQYGHDLGDMYLRKVGDYLKELSYEFKNLYACHVSGDEYILYLYDYDSFEIENSLVKKLEDIRKEYVEGRDNNRIYISLSIGVCRDSKGLSYDELLKRADYAMYIAKNSGKNNIHYFDGSALVEYESENVLYEDINKLISEELIDYAYQPIVDINTGEIYGYEALMRPTMQGMNPLKVINAAKKFSRLYDIERLTLFKSLSKFVKYNSDKKLFINSISSQVLNESDLDEFTNKFKDHFDHIVIELIEEDFGQSEVVKKKKAFLDKYNISYAIDDYGTGYNNIGMILSFSPKFVKIEGSLIRGIDKDEKKQRLTKSIISYCDINNIKVIAEAVETVEELKVVKSLGADYIQGYLLAKPQLEIKELDKEKKELLLNLEK